MLVNDNESKKKKKEAKKKNVKHPKPGQVKPNH